LNKRRKFYAPPPKDGKDIKELFAYAVEKGLGQPVDEQGVPKDQWTPESLADAIAKIDHPDAHVDLRTVQYWFQTRNQRSISAKSCRWLARIFGCGDGDAITEWQTALLSARRRFLEKRSGYDDAPHSEPPRERPDTSTATQDKMTDLSVFNRKRFNIAHQTEAMFGSESSLTLPLVVFAIACALALISFGLGISSVVYYQENGAPRQVGFLWAPNWTIVFMVVLPIFFACLIELLRCWKEEWRPQLLSVRSSPRVVRSWDVRLIKARHSFWVTVLVTVVIASGYNWVASHLRPLLDGDLGRWPIDWGRIAIVRPEVVSIPSSIAFSGLVFMYNGFTAYLFFAGHVLLLLLKGDLALLLKELKHTGCEKSSARIELIAVAVMTGVFRCTALGIVITIMMRLQSAFLDSSAINILEWLRTDYLSLFGQDLRVVERPKAASIPPGHIYSFFCVLAIIGTFVSAQVTIRSELSRMNISPSGSKWKSPWVFMNISMSLLVLSYLFIGLFPGFTMLVYFTLIITVYFISKPVRRELIVEA
jgi:hypothetical protein